MYDLENKLNQIKKLTFTSVHHSKPFSIRHSFRSTSLERKIINIFLPIISVLKYVFVGQNLASIAFISFPKLVVLLFDLILYVPSTIFQLNRDGSSWVEPVLS